MNHHGPDEEEDDEELPIECYGYFPIHLSRKTPKPFQHG